MKLTNRTKSVLHLQNAKNANSKDNWETPPELFKTIAIRFGVKCDLDVCATKLTTKCPKYFTEKDNSLNLDWNSHNGFFCNPPYSETKKWIAKCHEQFWKWKIPGVALVFNHTPAWYFDYIWDLKHERFYPHVRVYPIKKRVKFLQNGKPMRDKEGRLQNAPYDSCWVVWK